MADNPGMLGTILYVFPQEKESEQITNKATREHFDKLEKFNYQYF